MKTIAFYLPQFHPIKENDEWWGKGFTEWTNVAKAKKLYPGHEQPKIPADLGFYDLRLNSVREQQALLAQKHGIDAFCYWHYWFGRGRRLLEYPFDSVLSSKEPSLPFCLGWANESWKAKMWRKDESGDRLLIEQTYSKDDFVLHFKSMLSAFNDNRYLKVDGRPLFYIYRPLDHPLIKDFVQIWNELIRESGIADKFYFVGHTNIDGDIDVIRNIGFDAVNVVRLGEHKYNKKVTKKLLFRIFGSRLLNIPIIIPYRYIINYLSNNNDYRDDVIPTIIPNWDQTPRSANRGFVFHKSSPKLFQRHVSDVLSKIHKKPKELRLVFIKSWNEWAEGNYMEPDLKYGLKYLKVFKEERDKNV